MLHPQTNNYNSIFILLLLFIYLFFKKITFVEPSSNIDADSLSRKFSNVKTLMNVTEKPNKTWNTHCIYL